MSSGRGRGLAIHETELRRPGEAGLRQRFGNCSVSDGQVDKTQKVSVGQMDKTQKISEDSYAKLCNKIGQINLSTLNEELTECANEMKILCNTPEKFEKCVDDMFHFALKSKWNAHAIAIFCYNHGDIQVEQVKLRHSMLRKLQQLYNERNKAYLDKEKFLMDATFFCEIFYHVLIRGVCIHTLSSPVIDYLGMLVDGGSEKEIEVFVEQFPKCFMHLKTTNASGIDILIGKLRKQIVNSFITIPVRAMLLEIFELILTDWRPVSETAKIFYETLSKPIVRICS